jgi:16S rRNA (guanine966-N2)-methyltransferase
VRITGGVHRSRTLHAPKGTATRPTSDRVREAVFSILEAERSIEGARVLDLYAGTGALGLEALSRGALHVTLVEKAKDALVALRANVTALGVEDLTTIVAGPVERCAAMLGGASGGFDLVFADPPYADIPRGALAKALAAIVGIEGVLAADARVVVEHATNDDPPDLIGLSLDRSRRYGDTTVSIYTRP